MLLGQPFVELLARWSTLLDRPVSHLCNRTSLAAVRGQFRIIRWWGWLDVAQDLSLLLKEMARDYALFVVLTYVLPCHVDR